MRELEAKLVVPDASAFEKLAAADRLGTFAVRPGHWRLQQDTYLDTEGMRLRDAGYACRLRHTGHRAFAQLKGLGRVVGGVHDREEIEHELDNPSIGALLRLREPPGRLVRRVVGDERIVVLFTVVTQRRVSLVADGTHECFELALDRARFFGPRGEREFLELELESLDGDRERLEQVADGLRQRYGLAASELSKFERGLHWVGVEAG